MNLKNTTELREDSAKIIIAIKLDCLTYCFFLLALILILCINTEIELKLRKNLIFALVCIMNMVSFIRLNGRLSESIELLHNFSLGR